MKGIILAGGVGSRLHPLTRSISKQLLPVYDKPMIYYPLSTLMLSGIKKILIITDPNDSENFKQLLGNGSQLGITIEYEIQEKPEGIAQAFIIAEKFIADDPVCLILGDNVFYGDLLPNKLQRCAAIKDGAFVFCYYVKDPERYGVVALDKNNRIIEIEEKPENPPSHYAVTGLYFYDNTVIDKAKSLKPSPRGEYEITDINKLYLDEGKLSAEIMGRGMAWLDMGTHNSLLDASNFIRVLEERQNLKIACIEEVAYFMDYIDSTQLQILAEPLKQNEYGQYLMNLLKVMK